MTTKTESKVNKLAELGGWAGMILIHMSTIPVTINRLIDKSAAMPPLSMIFMVWLGLALFFIRAAARKDTLYVVSNFIGFVLQSALLALIVM